MHYLRLPLPTLFVILGLFAGALSRGETSTFPPSKDFAVETVATDLSNPMEMSIAGDLVFIAELHGRIKVVDLATGFTRVVAHLEVDYRKQGPRWSWDVESGVLGIAVDPDFDKNNWVYLCYTRPGGESVTHDHVVSRFRYENGLLNKASEQVILKIPALRDLDRIHEAGSLAFGPGGNLYISSGDNQDHTQYLYSARTSTNSAVLNGKILRVRPGKTGAIPFRPVISFRPVRQIPVRRFMSWVVATRFGSRLINEQAIFTGGENGPADYYCGNLKNVDQKLLPLGFDEFNQARKAGFFGWPFFIGPNESYPTYAFDTKSVTGAFDPKKPINDLKENTGLKKLPPAQQPMIWYSHPPSKTFPSLGQGGASAIGGPVFYHDESRQAEAGGLPKSFDHHWFIADYARGWVKMVELDKDEKMVGIKAFPTEHRFQTPINVKFNRNGQLFVLQYGKGGWEANNGGSLLRISHRIDGGLAGNQVVARSTLRGLSAKHPGTALMRQNNCAACHQVGGSLIGPSFQQIIERYAALPGREEYLGKQIQKGSKGVWGELYQMPGHPYLKEDQIEQIVKALFTLKLVRHAALDHPVALENPASKHYPGRGSAELVDGIRGDENDLKNDWLGFEGDDLIATIDLGETTSVHELGLSSCQVTAAGVFLPSTVEFQISSDAKTFQTISSIKHEVSLKEPTKKITLSTKFSPIMARYIRVNARNLGAIPDWHQAKGRKAWLFIDELLVNPLN